MPAVSRIYAADGTLLGEFAREWREFVAYDEIPAQLSNAFLAVEDLADFFNHGGIYFKGIVRAAWANLSARDFAQGGSTITQQVAKQFLGAEKSISRKLKEAITARRLEALYSKKAILAVYLNQIYLGDGAWGVRAAARRYFQKDLAQLTLAECALIAGLAKAPTAYSPVAHEDHAIERRNLVLDRMAQYGFTSQADVDAAKKEGVTLNLYRDIFPDRMPYYAEHVRRYITERYGNDALFSDSLRVETAAEPSWESRRVRQRRFRRASSGQAAGLARSRVATRRCGTRHVRRAPEAAVRHRPARERQALPRGRRQGRRRARRGDRRRPPVAIAAAQHDVGGEVAGRQRRQRRHDRERDRGAQARLRDLGVARGPHGPEISRLEPARQDQPDVDRPRRPARVGRRARRHRATRAGAASADHDLHRRSSQRLRGRDGRRRRLRPLRVQPRGPGVSPTGLDHYKPIYYSLGLDQGYGFDTVLADMPIEITDPNTGEVWTPTNLGETLDNAVTLEYALVFSKNIPSVDLFRKLGAKNAWSSGPVGSASRPRSSRTMRSPSARRAASSTRWRARSPSFARLGAWWPRGDKHDKDWVYVRRIVDRNGRTIGDGTIAGGPAARRRRSPRPGRRARGRHARAGDPAAHGVLDDPPARARGRVRVLETVLRATGLIAAGKTGTSSATHDELFIAFTAKFTTLVWMGDDKKERALGKSDAAYMKVVPLWARYMYEAARGYPNTAIPWTVPPGVNKDDRGDH